MPAFYGQGVGRPSRSTVALAGVAALSQAVQLAGGYTARPTTVQLVFLAATIVLAGVLAMASNASKAPKKSSRSR